MSVHAAFEAIGTGLIRLEDRTRISFKAPHEPLTGSVRQISSSIRSQESTQIFEEIREPHSVRVATGTSRKSSKFLHGSGNLA